MTKFTLSITNCQVYVYKCASKTLSRHSKMEVLTNKKGSKKVLHQGYTFTKKKTTKSTTRWECSKRHSLSCKGALVSDLDVTRVISVTDHNHEADQFEVEALKLRYEIMDAADANRGKSGQILADKLVNYPVEVRVAAGKKDTLKRAIRRVKRGTAPPEPTTASDIPCPLPIEYTKTPQNSCV